MHFKDCPLSELPAWIAAHTQTEEQMFPLEKDWYTKSCYCINALGPVYNSYWITIEKQGHSKWVVFAEDHGEDEMDLSSDGVFKTLREAAIAAREFCRFFYDCWVENNDPE